MIEWNKISEFLVSGTFLKWLVFAVVAIALIITSSILKKKFNQRTKDASQKYRARRAINFITYLLILLIVLFAFRHKLGQVGVTIGVVGAGVAFALQDVIMSFAGFLFLTFSGKIAVGDRIKVDNVKGDLIHIGVLSSTIMELGEWVDGDLYNGRTVSVSNSFVFKQTVHNYSGDYPFLWDEIVIPINSDSDYMAAKELFYNVLNDVCGKYAKDSAETWNSLTNKYLLEAAKIDPMVTVSIDANWITFTLRYVVDYKSRRTTKDLLFCQIIDKVKSSSNIEIAYSTLTISQEG